jgi:hypothetical protein
VAVDLGIVDKRGAYFSYGDARLGQGRENTKAFLRENPELAREISDSVRKATGLAPVPWPVRQPAERSEKGDAHSAAVLEEPSREAAED